MSLVPASFKSKLEDLANLSIETLEGRIKDEKISERDLITILNNSLRILKDCEFGEEEVVHPSSDKFVETAQSLINTLKQS